MTITNEEGLLVSLAQIRSDLGESKYLEFGKWFTGRTGVIDEITGELMVFEHDYRLFRRMQRIQEEATLVHVPTNN